MLPFITPSKQNCMVKNCILFLLVVFSAVFMSAGISENQPSTFTDPRDGRTYKMVKIGSQYWMAENLNYASTGWCYDDITENCNIYGRLYTWEQAMAGQASSSLNPSGVQGICPPGWHLPSDNEWSQLTDWLEANGHSYSQGTALKASSAHSPPWNGTDNYGFSALPGGFRDSDGSFVVLGIYGGWWSASEFIFTDAWYHGLGSSHAGIFRLSNVKGCGFSVRCIRD